MDTLRSRAGYVKGESGFNAPIPAAFAPAARHIAIGGVGIAPEPIQLVGREPRRAWSHDRSRLAVLRATTTSDVVMIRGLQE